MEWAGRVLYGIHALDSLVKAAFILKVLHNNIVEVLPELLFQIIAFVGSAENNELLSPQYQALIAPNLRSDSPANSVSSREQFYTACDRQLFSRSISRACTNL